MNSLIGKKVRIFREKQNLTQTELGESVGISPQFISLLEKGERRASDSTLERLSKFLKIDKEELLD